ncbi:50S ribosomal protein L31 [Candidatus Daviesbacteria bacterium]|nr:50S ribosomal protein L31 [Candidatus Daviesbacteria bacterium]
MKQGVHPNWYPEAKVTCACGSTFVTGSTLESIRVEICSKCHPLFTGQQKFVDTLGQVERFQRKSQTSQAKAAQRQQVLQTRQAKVKEGKSEKPSLKDLLIQARKNLKTT